MAYRLWCPDCDAEGVEGDRYTVDQLLGGHEEQNPGHTPDCMGVGE